MARCWVRCAVQVQASQSALPRSRRRLTLYLGSGQLTRLQTFWCNSKSGDVARVRSLHPSDTSRCRLGANSGNSLSKANEELDQAQISYHSRYCGWRKRRKPYVASEDSATRLRP